MFWALLFVVASAGLIATLVISGNNPPPVNADIHPIQGNPAIAVLPPEKHTHPQIEVASKALPPQEKPLAGDVNGSAVDPPSPKADQKPGFPPVPGPAAPLPVDALQKKIDAAVERGVNWLKKSQNKEGSWGKQKSVVGYTALSGLTLLECGVPPKDAAVQKAAAFVKGNCADLTTTYELSLAVLFLDRLGDSRDKKLIQTMALRLLAGQTEAGGWTYRVPMLSGKDHLDLLTFLQRSQPKLPAPAGKDKADTNPLGKANELPNPLAGKDPKLTSPIDKFASPANPLAGDIEKKMPNPVGGKSASDTSKPGIIPFFPDGPPEPQKKDEKDARPRGDMQQPEKAKGPLPVLPPHLRQIPAVVGAAKGKSDGPVLARARDDNSNTQFALLALWAARRHDVPTDPSLQFAYQRFVATQDKEHGWGYHVSNARGRPAMVGVGLLGLAMGHGSGTELPKDDSSIKNGLLAFAKHIGEPGEAQRNQGLPPLYFLWTVERVAMLYDLKTIGGKDWYRWGSQLLLSHQAADGSWRSGGYPGSSVTIDTCFALLFLKRSNLVHDLTDTLQLQMGITDPQSKK